MLQYYGDGSCQLLPNLQYNPLSAQIMKQQLSRRMHMRVLVTLMPWHWPNLLNLMDNPHIRHHTPDIFRA